MATKILPADKVFSDYIRTRDKWTCQRPTCGKVYPPPTMALHNSHFFGRGKWSTRYDPDNCTALCYGCHRYMDKHTNEYELFKIAELGQAGFDALSVRAWSRSQLGSTFWKRLTPKKAQEIFQPLFDALKE